MRRIINPWQEGCRSLRNAPGVILSNHLEGGAEVQRDLARCVHCEFLWPWNPKEPGRGWCFRCMGPACGQPACRARGCVPAAQMIENMEQGRPLDYVPIRASVPASSPGGILLGRG